jgi:hypothetical protein
MKGKELITRRDHCFFQAVDVEYRFFGCTIAVDLIEPREANGNGLPCFESIGGIENIIAIQSAEDHSAIGQFVKRFAVELVGVQSILGVIIGELAGLPV